MPLARFDLLRQSGQAANISDDQTLIEKTERIQGVLEPIHCFDFLLAAGAVKPRAFVYANGVGVLRWNGTARSTRVSINDTSACQRAR
jgi:hypothetical protein